MQALNSLLTGHGHTHIVKSPDNESVVSTAPCGAIVKWNRSPDALTTMGAFVIPAEDQPLIAKVCLLVERHGSDNRLLTADVYMSKRVPADAPKHHAHGWLEYVVVMHYNTGSRLTVGVIQRTIGADIECHS